MADLTARPVQERPLRLERRSQLMDMIRNGYFDSLLDSIEDSIKARRILRKQKALEEVQAIFGPGTTIVDSAGHRV